MITTRLMILMMIPHARPIYIYIYMCMYIYIYMYSHICMYAYIYIYIYIYIHISLCPVRPSGPPIAAPPRPLRPVVCITIIHHYIIIYFLCFWPRGSSLQVLGVCSGGGQVILQRFWVVWPLTRSLWCGEDWTQDLRLMGLTP